VTNTKKLLITGAAGFIGSHLTEYFLKKGDHVVGLDNYATGFRENIVTFLESQNFKFIEADIRNAADCTKAVQDCDYVLHQAALGSVPRSLEDPRTTNNVNITGFLNMLIAARDAGVKRFVYAASSSTYGDHPGLPKVEDSIGKPLSPYAVTKYVNELYADVFSQHYGMETIGLRYFNVFGPRQNPDGAYAAVIPKFILKFLRGEDIEIHGDGAQSRDFTYVDNVVRMNELALETLKGDALNQVYNVACNDRTSLNQLIQYLKKYLESEGVNVDQSALRHIAERPGDVKHSQADISKAKRLLGYQPSFSVDEGLRNTVMWFLDQYQSAKPVNH